MTSTLSCGTQGEIAVIHHLQQQGFTILEQNYRQRFGEIDVIGKYDNLLVFVEVKTRSTMHVFDHTQTITPAKQRKIIAVARQYIAKYKYHEYDCRFDVAIVHMKHTSPRVDLYVENAFGVEN